jgi:hypothetical protein
MAVTIGPGWSIGEGWSIGGGNSGGSGAVIVYTEMPGPVSAGGPGSNLQDPSATVNNPVGFTINDDTLTGVAVVNLSASNQAYFVNYGPGLYTCIWGPGSTVASSVINIFNISGPFIQFQIQGQTGPATYNYPFTFT